MVMADWRLGERSFPDCDGCGERDCDAAEAPLPDEGQLLGV